MNDLDALFLTK